MAKYLYYICACCFLFLFSRCGKGKSESEEIPFNPYVEAFTSGTISRYTPVYLIFNQEIAVDRMEPDQLRDLVKIKPETVGEFAFENNRTIVFKPSKSFERDTRYEVKADLSEWFDTERKDKYFSFRFSTQPLLLRANLQSVDINRKNENGYDIVCSVFTPDREIPETVESLVRFSEKANARWQHSPDGKRHEISISNIQAGTDATRAFKLSVAPNKLKVPEEELLSVDIPELNDFAVYEVEYVAEPERYVEVTFTKLLDAAQNMQGLAWIDGNKSETVNVEGNKLRLYPDAGSKGALNVHLSQNIRSKNGLNLKESVVRQIVVSDEKPEVRFIGNGVIIPQSTQLTIPFQAVYLRGVVVRVIKIFEQNIGQFLQVNDLEGTSDLMRVGRLIARKTIFLDEDATQDLSRWNTYAIDLKELIDPEPGAIYRVELSFNRDLSAYPCEDLVKKSKEQLLADDEIKFKEESSRFDGGGYYYYNGDFDWSDYDYSKRGDPCSNSYYYNTTVGKNVLATNLGLLAMAGEDNDMTVLVHNILSTHPEKGVKVVVYNYQRQELASGVTDDKGQVRFSLKNGKPFYLTASLGQQRSYLRVDDGSALSLSSFDVSGEVVQKGIKGFIYGILDGTIPPEMQNHYLQLVSEETGRLARLIQNMLDLSKLESGEYQVNARMFNIWETLTGVALSAEQRINDGMIDLEGLTMDEKVLVYADPDLIHQVAYNILDNAIKFTPAGGTIKFHVEKLGPEVEISIWNSGQGISPEALPYVFQRFYKEDRSRGLHARGAGLGLNICKVLVNLSGGQIRVESQQGEWCQFVFTLPAASRGCSPFSITPQGSSILFTPNP